MNEDFADYKVQINFSLDSREDEALFGTAAEFFSALEMIDSLVENLTGFSGESVHRLDSMEPGSLVYSFHHYLSLEGQCSLGMSSDRAVLRRVSQELRSQIMTFLESSGAVTRVDQLEELQLNLSRLFTSLDLPLELSATRISLEKLVRLLSAFSEAAEALRPGYEIKLQLDGRWFIFSSGFSVDREALDGLLSEGVLVLSRRGILEVDAVPFRDSRGELKGRYFFRYGRQVLSLVPRDVPGTPDLTPGSLVSVDMEERISHSRQVHRYSVFFVLKAVGTPVPLPRGRQLDVFS